MRKEMASSFRSCVMPRCAGKSFGFAPPILWREVEIFGADKVADAAALVGFGDAGPEAVEFLFELVGLVEKNRGAGNQIENGAVGSGDGSVKLPAGKDVDAAGADGGFDDLFVTDDALAAEAGVNCAEQMLADRSFGEWEKQGLVYGVRGALGCRVELANGIGFVAEELDA